MRAGSDSSEFVVETDPKFVILLANTICRGTGAHLPCRLKHGGMCGLSSGNHLVDFKHINSPDHLIDCAETEFRLVAAKFFGKIIKEVDDLLRLARELGTQLRILGRNADRTRIDYSAHDDQL